MHLMPILTDNYTYTHAYKIHVIFFDFPISIGHRKSERLIKMGEATLSVTSRAGYETSQTVLSSTLLPKVPPNMNIPLHMAL